MIMIGGSQLIINFTVVTFLAFRLHWLLQWKEEAGVDRPQGGLLSVISNTRSLHVAKDGASWAVLVREARI